MGQLFGDGRGAALRATWHEEAGLVVLSVWRGDRCTASVRLSPAEAERLSALLREVAERPPPAPSGHAIAPGTSAIA